MSEYAAFSGQLSAFSKRSAACRHPSLTRLRLTATPWRVTHHSCHGVAVRRSRASLITHHLSPRCAFTLVELIVSVAILLALMAMIGMIFSTAGKASGTAQASTALYRQLRQITENIRLDLQYTKPGAGVMAIAGVTATAYATPEDQANKAATGLHRADVLMLLTQREFEPFVYSGTASFDTYQQVIYGHANLGRLNPESDDWIGGAASTKIRTVEGDPSAIPASQWHLARRIIGFPANALSGNNTAAWPLTSKNFTGQVPLAQYADVTTFPWSLLDSDIKKAYGYFEYNGSNLETYYAWDASDAANKFLCWPSLGDAGKRLFKGGHWYSVDSSVATGWSRTELPGPATYEPSLPVGTLPTPGDFWLKTFYENGLSRPLLDPNPPAGRTRERRLAAYFLPGCADFQVEYTYDDPQELAIGTNGSVTLSPSHDLLNDYGATLVPNVAPRAIHWLSVDPGQKIVWARLPAKPSDYSTADAQDLRDRTHPFRWPTAVRITIRVYDPSHRLTEPVTQTIVHAWQ